MTTQGKNVFSWDVITQNAGIARPSLGLTTRIEVYRMLQFSLRAVLEESYGPEVADDLFRKAGVLAGKAFYEQFCGGSASVNELVKILQEKLKEFGIGVLRLEKTNLETLNFILTVDEDLDCSGLPDTAEVVCVYDEGFLQGILESFTGKDFEVREIDCWCTGERTCRFSAKPVS